MNTGRPSANVHCLVIPLPRKKDARNQKKKSKKNEKKIRLVEMKGDLETLMMLMGRSRMDYVVCPLFELIFHLGRTWTTQC